MTTARDMTTALINRVRSLKEFKVQSQLPDGFAIYGYIPFNLTIRDGVITARVLAESQSEAQDCLDRFIESQS